MPKKEPLDLDTCSREKLVAKIENLRRESANHQAAYVRAIAAYTTLTTQIRKLKKVVRDFPV